MVNIVKRMRNLREKVLTPPHITRQALLWIRVGPGALILPKEVTKISMEFNRKLYGGHRGARHFWREMLPRIKFRNPTIPISIVRHNDADGPSLLHIYTSSSFSSPNATTTAADSSSSASATPTPVDASTPTHTIDIRGKNESEILDLLVEKTGAVQLQPTEQELEEQREIAEFKVRSEKDRVEVREKLVAQRREEELLRLARGETS